MKISLINNYPSNQNKKAQAKNTPNFQALKSIKYKGLYKKYPKYGDEIIAAIENNYSAQKFFDKWDVDIVLNTVHHVKSCWADHYYGSGGLDKRSMNVVKIFYEHPDKSILSKLEDRFYRFLGIYDDCICLSTSYYEGYWREDTLEDLLKVANRELKEKVSNPDSNIKKSGYLTGRINSIIEREKGVK